MPVTKEKIGFYRKHPRVVYKNGETINPRTGEVTPLPSMAQQQFADECDINNILKQYKVSGIVRHISAKAELGRFEDLPTSIDFQESMNEVLAAQRAFADLPSSIRNRFENDPVQFLDFMSDPGNQDEIIRLGLARDTRGLQPGDGGDRQPPPAGPPGAAAAGDAGKGPQEGK